MLVLALDVATRTGWALGEPGEKPRIGWSRLKKPDDPVHVAWRNAGFFLKDLFLLDRPDLIVAEAPLAAAAQRSDAAATLQLGAIGVVVFMAAAYEIRLEFANAQTVSKHFTGKARWSQAEG